MPKLGPLNSKLDQMLQSDSQRDKAGLLPLSKGEFEGRFLVLDSGNNQKILFECKQKKVSSLQGIDIQNRVSHKTRH